MRDRNLWAISIRASMDQATSRLLLARLLHVLPKGRWWLLRQKETQDNKKKRSRAASVSEVSIGTALKLTRASIDAVFVSAGIYPQLVVEC